MAAIEAKAATLFETADAHFAWILGEAPAPSAGLKLPPCGLGTSEVLTMWRRSAERLRALRDGGNWMIVVQHEVVGLCSYRKPPNAEGVVEIGYSIAEDRRGLGYATQAIAGILEYAMTDSSVRCVTAGTAPENTASQRVLEKNGFVAAGRYLDPKWGDSILWRRDLRKRSLV
jgi:RimJ/RimL family protein N-acetyltransferase